MRVRLLAFAVASDLLGSSELDLELPEGATVADLRAEVERRAPRLAGWGARLAVAVDGEIAPPERLLTVGCEVALLPPVSGG